jgi:tripartite-type tricarboxylate transporter receptor subunit TctC
MRSNGAVQGRRRRFSMTAATHHIALAMLMLVALAMGMRPAGADSLADFYKGKTLTILVGYGAGGGYDIYARVIAQFLGKHIPGEPSVIVQNMPGAGGLKAARYMLDVAPKDGTVLSIPSQTISFDTVTGYSAGVDAAKFQWLGRFAQNVEVGLAYAKTGIATIDDLRNREIPVGGTGGTASTTVIPFLLNKLAGTKFKIVSGYKGAYDVVLAMERDEMQMVAGIGLATTEVRFGKQIKDGTIRVILQSGLGRHPDIPNVPNIDEFGRTDEEKQMLALFASTAAIGRSLVAPPGVPADRIAALRQAVADTIADPELRKFSAEHTIMIEPGTAAEVEATVKKTLATPKDLADKMRAVLESMKSEK